jgi:hypothetical protein
MLQLKRSSRRRSPLVIIAAFAADEFPHVGEIMPEIEDAPTCAWQIACGSLPRSAAQCLAALASHSAEVDREIAQKLHVKAVVFGRHLDPPPADRPMIFERQVV